MKRNFVVLVLFLCACGKSSKQAFLETPAFTPPQTPISDQSHPAIPPIPVVIVPSENPPTQNPPQTQGEIPIPPNPPVEIPPIPTQPETPPEIEIGTRGACSDNRTQERLTNLWLVRHRNESRNASLVIIETDFPPETLPANRNSCLYATTVKRIVGVIPQSIADLTRKKLKFSESLLSQVRTGCFMPAICDPNFPECQTHISVGAGHTSTLTVVGNLVNRAWPLPASRAALLATDIYQHPEILIGFNTRNSVQSQGEPMPGETTTPEHPVPSECETTESPLLIDLSGDGVELSSQAEGVDFDIRGDGSHDRISWPVHRDDAFVALPKHGRVDSVQELFGNNTVGPDGRLADNGFEALAKFDGNHDGVIDRNDRVYHALRLWIDRRRDGKANRMELFPLDRFHIDSIDLNYVPMFESDIYGNETRQRSVVQMRNDFRMIFDVWFKPL